MMAERHEGSRGFGSQDEWPYSGSGPSGSSEIEAGLAQLEALRYVDVSGLPSGQDDTPQDTPPPTAAELRESLREIADATEPIKPAASQTQEGIRTALHGCVEALKQPAQIAEENKKKEQKKALKRVAETLRVAPDVLSIVTCKLENLVVQEGISTDTMTSLRSVLVLLESINPRDLEVAQQEVEKAINVMDTKESSHQ
ncbi:MAG: hypothetical protein HXL00_00275 [Candidatus Nanosynbacter sp.]|nr:hypothetical protein [Candidatus Nanosynbacter sp.]